MDRIVVSAVCLILIFSSPGFFFDFEQNVTADIDENPSTLAPVTFTNVTPSVGLSGVSGNFFAWGDYNNDGYQDLLVNGRRLFKNTGPPLWKFNEVTSAAGISGGNYGTWGDYDNDGYLDFYSPGHDILWHNDGDGTFTDVTSSAGNIRDTYPSVACGWGDYDLDGYIDLYIANYEDADMNGFPDALWHNNGNGTFTNVTASAGIIESEPSRGVSWGDYNDDGYPDIYISNYRIRPNHLWENDGDGTFTNVAVARGVEGDETQRLGESYYGHTVGSAWADYDNDGDFDIWCTNLAHKDVWRGPICDDSYMYRNNGPGENYNFTNVRQFTDIPTKNIGGGEDELMVGVAWGDYDNDGYLDLFLPQIYNDVAYAYSYLYHSDGDGTFTEVSTQTGVRVWDTYGGAWCDYNNDGWLDLVTGGKGESSENGTHEIHLYKNNGNDNNWLQLTLIGKNSNSAAIGARVTASSGSMIQLREVEGGMGAHSMQNSLPLEFGWGNYSGTVDISVRWPTGFYKNLSGVNLNQHIEIEEVEVFADLAITNITVSKKYPVQGDILEFKATIENIGVARSKGATVIVYEHPEFGDGSVKISEIEISELEPGWVTPAYANWNTTGKSGNYDISFEIDNVVPGDDNLSNNFQLYNIIVRESNELPIAVLEVEPVYANVDETIIFNGTSSYDDIGIVRYKFYFGDGKGTTWTTAAFTAHEYEYEGEYDAYLVVEDYDGAYSNTSLPSATQKITISSKPINHAPVINSISVQPEVVPPGGKAKIEVDAFDEDGDEINYIYMASSGTISGSGAEVLWLAPQTEGDYDITIYVTDEQLQSPQQTVTVTVSPSGAGNQPPEIITINVEPDVIDINGVATITVNAYDPEGNDLLYIYTVTGGTISGIGSKVTYYSDGKEGKYQITVVVNDGELDSLPASTSIEIYANDPPEITAVVLQPEEVETGGMVTITVFATDPDGDTLSFNYEPKAGTIVGSGNSVTWKAPSTAGIYEITITVFDQEGLSSEEIVIIEVFYGGGPEIIDFKITPDSVGNDGKDKVLFAVEINHPGGLFLIEDVYVDLSPLGGSSKQKLFDNGQRGDERSSDGIYSLQYGIPYDTRPGDWILTVVVVDSDGNTAEEGSVLIIKKKVSSQDTDRISLSSRELAQLGLGSILILIIVLLILFYYIKKPKNE